MSRIRSKNTKPEIIVRHALHKLGFRFRLDSKVGKIKPDIVLRSRKVAIFVHGCFWHQHSGCKLAYSGRDYSKDWLKKFENNKERDIRTNKQLTNEGWRVAIVWECGTRNKNDFKKIIFQLDNFIKNSENNIYESVLLIKNNTKISR